MQFTVSVKRNGNRNHFMPDQLVYRRDRYWVRPCSLDNSNNSLPADVLWGSFVTRACVRWTSLIPTTPSAFTVLFSQKWSRFSSLFGKISMEMYYLRGNTLLFGELKDGIITHDLLSLNRSSAKRLCVWPRATCRTQCHVKFAIIIAFH